MAGQFPAPAPRFTTLSPAKLLDKLAETQDDLPGERTVRTYLREWELLADAERADYGRVNWPETFDRNLLPWDAAPHIGEIYRLAGIRPTVRFARHYWHAIRSMPGHETREHRHVALLLAMADYAAPEYRPNILRDVEAFVFGLAPDIPAMVSLVDERLLQVMHDYAVLGGLVPTDRFAEALRETAGDVSSAAEILTSGESH